MTDAPPVAAPPAPPAAGRWQAPTALAAWALWNTVLAWIALAG
ncbi:hypothetical protein [Botrimarina sp.]